MISIVYIYSFIKVIKIILSVLCYQISTPTMSALAADHRNDVVATLVALVFGIIGKINTKGKEFI